MKTGMYLVVAMVFSQFACAGGFTDVSNREGTWEAGFIINQVDSWDASGRGGSSIDIDSDTGWGFALGYNFNAHLNLSFLFTHNEQQYDADIVDASAPTNIVTISHELDNDVYEFNFSYHFLDRALTPYISGGVGWTYLDSNISSGDGGLVCWYDYWWGYVCDSYYSTYSDTSFSYSVGAGMRWDIVSGFTLKASVNQRFIDLDNTSESPDLSYAKLELIWLM